MGRIILANLQHVAATVAKNIRSLLHILSNRIVLSLIRFLDEIVRRMIYNANRHAVTPFPNRRVPRWRPGNIRIMRQAPPTQARSLAHSHSAKASIKALEPKSRPDEPALPVGALR